MIACTPSGRQDFADAASKLAACPRTPAAGAAATIKEVTHEGTVLTVAGPHVSPVERPAREAELRRECLQALRNAGLR